MFEIIYQTYLVALPTVLGYIVWLLKQTNQKSEAKSEALMLLLKIQLIQYHDKYMTQGFIPSYAYGNFIEMYDCYHALGGNGTVTKMKQEIDKLDIRKDVDNV